MKRSRIGLLITLALFAALLGAGVAGATDTQRWSEDGPGLSSGAVSDSRRPAVRPTTGEPDLGTSNAPTKMGVRQVAPPTPTPHGHPGGQSEWVARIWAAWFRFLMR